jgi:hypothetical protein
MQVTSRRVFSITWNSCTAFRVNLPRLASARVSFHSPSQVIVDLLDHDLTKFEQRKPVPPNFWFRQETRRLFFECLGRRIGFSCFNDWYSIDRTTVNNRGGGYILARYYNDSLVDALADVFPEHQWLPWMFKQVPRHYWSDSNNCRAYLEWVAPALHVETVEHWYSVSANDLRLHYGTISHYFSLIFRMLTFVSLGAGVLFCFENSVANLLAAAYPAHPWDVEKFRNKPRRPLSPSE